MITFKQLNIVFLNFTVINKKGVWSSQDDYRNILIQNYYQPSGTPSLCRKHVKSLYNGLAHWTWIPDCTSNQTDAAFRSVTLYVSLLHPMEFLQGLKYKKFKPKLDEPPSYITFLVMAQNAVISESGAIVSENVKIFPDTISWNREPVLPESYQEAAFYKEVFTISQFYSKNVYHSNIDQIPRIAPYLQFLGDNPEIKVHIGMDRVRHNSNTLEMLGINPNRIINGTVRAGIVYFPEGSMSNFPRVQNVQILSKEYRKIIKKLILIQEHKSIIMIRRSKIRYFRQLLEVEGLVYNMTIRYGLRYELFDDQNLPELEDTMTMFNRAVLVVAPHGAGLFNTIFSEPGTIILETICKTPGSNVCFMRLSHVLGHRHYASQSVSGCDKDGIVVNLTEFEMNLKFYMPLAVQISKGKL